jgi:hypothetical protein
MQTSMMTDFTITRRIHDIFERAVRRFRGEVRNARYSPHCCCGNMRPPPLHSFASTAHYMPLNDFTDDAAHSQSLGHPRNVASLFCATNPPKNTGAALAAVSRVGDPQSQCARRESNARKVRCLFFRSFIFRSTSKDVPPTQFTSIHHREDYILTAVLLDLSSLHTSLSFHPLFFLMMINTHAHITQGPPAAPDAAATVDQGRHVGV